MKMSRKFRLEYLKEVAAMDFRIYTAELLKKSRMIKKINCEKIIEFYR